MLDALTKIARQEGVRGLQRGLAPAYLLQFSNVGTRFGVYALAKSAFNAQDERDRLLYAKQLALAGPNVLRSLLLLQTCLTFGLLSIWQQSAGLQGSLVCARLWSRIRSFCSRRDSRPRALPLQPVVLRISINLLLELKF